MGSKAGGGGRDDTLVLPSQLARMAEAREWVAARAVAAGFDERAVWEVELAVTEALSNVIHHSYHDDESREVHLSLDVDDEKLTVVVRGFGKPFDRTAYRPEDRDPDRPGGYGISLIEQAMDEVAWEDNGNRLRLSKYRPAGDGREGPHRG